jgi:hypothetical protein
VRSLKICFCTHLEVPSGGSRGFSRGASDGDGFGQTRGGQIGFKSNVLVHTASTFPFIQTQRHPAFAPLIVRKRVEIAKNRMAI